MPAANERTDSDLVEDCIKHAVADGRPAKRAPTITWIRANLEIGYVRAKRVRELTQEIIDVARGEADEEPVVVEDDDRLSLTASQRDTKITPDELIAMMDVDLRVWQATKEEIKTWPVVTKGLDGEPAITQVFYTRVVLELIESARGLVELFEAVIDQMRELSPTARSVPRSTGTPTSKDNALLVMSLPDAHFGKLAWSKETGQSWNTEIARDVYVETVRRLIEMSDLSGVERVLYVVGNDLLHVDSGKNTTTAGTPQDVDGRWQYAFQTAYESIIETTNMLAEVAPVDMVIQPGNHDRERAYLIGHSLSAYFYQHDYVKIDNEPTPRKYYDYGRVLLGMAHGDEEKLADLPLIMAGEKPAMWVAASYREWLVGHIHRRRALSYMPMDEKKGVRIRVLPSLTATDSWHASKGFVGQNRSGVAIVYGQDGESVKTAEALLVD